GRLVAPGHTLKPGAPGHAALFRRRYFIHGAALQNVDKAGEPAAAAASFVHRERAQNLRAPVGEILAGDGQPVFDRGIGLAIEQGPGHLDVGRHHMPFRLRVVAGGGTTRWSAAKPATAGLPPAPPLACASATACASVSVWAISWPCCRFMSARKAWWLTSARSSAS